LNIFNLPLGAMNRYEILTHALKTITPGSPREFLMAAFVHLSAQKVTAQICPVQPFVM